MWAGVLLERLIFIIHHVRELHVGGSVVGAVNLYYISCARVICGREHSWSGYIWAGELLERLIQILYHVSAS